jgi:PKD repeat protein
VPLPRHGVFNRLPRGISGIIFSVSRRENGPLADKLFPMECGVFNRGIVGSFMAAWLALVTATGAQPALAQENESGNRYMISHARNAGPQALEVVRENNGRRARRLRYRDIIAADLTEEQLARLRRHPLFKHAYIELDPPRYLLASNSEETVTYGIPQIQADQLAPGSSPVTVCIIDTGYDTSHSDLPGYERVTGVTLAGGTWDNPGHEHGTHVAGTIAAIEGNGRGIVGVHPGAQLSLHIVKIFNDSGRWTNSSDIVDALDSCVARGADIVSMSLGGLSSSSVEGQAFSEALVQNGVLSFAAAGNSGSAAMSYPASHDAVVSVGAVDSSMDHADFSQRNEQVELVAAGVGVDSTVLGNDYDRKNGTSMATPHVSGAAALLWSRNPDCSAIDIRRALSLTARDLGIPGRDDTYGYGLVQVRDAHDLIASQGCDLPSPEERGNLPPIAELSADPIVGSPPLTVLFDSSRSRDDEEIVSRTWDFGIGSAREGDVQESFTYEDVGSYSASVTVFDEEGLSNTASVIIEVIANNPPNAAFSIEPQDGADTGTVLHFDGRPSQDPEGDSLSYRWDFGDGGISSKKRPLHRFAAEGVYRVTLSVVDAFGGRDATYLEVPVAAALPFSDGNIQLAVKLKDGGSKARLRWTGATTDNVKILRNGTRLKRTANDGQWRDAGYTPGDSYQVCNTNTRDCSAPVAP